MICVSPSTSTYARPPISTTFACPSCPLIVKFRPCCSCCAKDMTCNKNGNQKISSMFHSLSRIMRPKETARLSPRGKKNSVGSRFVDHGNTSRVVNLNVCTTASINRQSMAFELSKMIGRWQPQTGLYLVDSFGAGVSRHLAQATGTFASSYNRFRCGTMEQLVANLCP